MNKKTKDSLPIFIVLFSILLALTVVLNVLNTGDGDAIMNGFKAVFGGEVGSIGSFASVDVVFSIINFIVFFLPVILAILLFVLGGSRKKDKRLNLLLALLLTASFVFSIVILSDLGAYTKGTVALGGIGGDYTYEGSKLAIGSILAIVFSSGGIIASLFHGLGQVK